MMRCAMLLFLSASLASAQEPRRIYLLHSGVHILPAPPDKNFGARLLFERLRERGIAERDLIVMDCPFPQASDLDPLPKEGISMFLDSMNLDSKAALDGYVRLHQTLVKHGVKKEDKLIWVGYSAGGQMGLSMAGLADRHAQIPALAGTSAWPLDIVVTLGTPIGTNHAPKEVRVRQYFSYGDRIVELLTVSKKLVASYGGKHEIRFFSPNLGENAIARRFEGLEHPEWIWNPRVLDRIVREAKGIDGPVQVNGLSPGRDLSAALLRAVEKQTKVLVQDVLP